MERLPADDNEHNSIFALRMEDSAESAVISLIGVQWTHFFTFNRYELNGVRVAYAPFVEESGYLSCNHKIARHKQAYVYFLDSS